MPEVYDVVGRMDLGALGMLGEETIVAKHDDELLVLQATTIEEEA